MAKKKAIKAVKAIKVPGSGGDKAAAAKTKTTKKGSSALPKPKSTAPTVLTALFDQGQTPTISCVNLCSIPLGFQFKDLVAALQEYVDNYFVPIWAMKCKLVVTTKVLPNTWGLVLMDDADVANALGYHELTPDGFPLSKIFVKTLMQYGEHVATTASHEITEMLVDPGIQMWSYNYIKDRFEAYEVADAVEADTFDIMGFPMSNFVHPAWFESFRQPQSAKFDYMGLCIRPFEIRPGGYMPVYKNGKWSQIFASKADKKAFIPELHSRFAMRKTKPDKRKKSAPGTDYPVIVASA